LARVRLTVERTAEVSSVSSFCPIDGENEVW